MKTRRFVGLTLLLAVTLLAGCETLSSLNPFSDDEEESNDEPTPLAEFKAEAEVDVLWTRQVGDGTGSKYYLLAPAIGGDRIYAADGYGKIAAYQLSDGKLVWSQHVGAPAESSFWDGLQFWKDHDLAYLSGGVGAGDGIVMVGTTEGEVFALDDLSGSPLWQAKVSSEVVDAPQTNGQVVALQTLDGRLYGLERESGKQRWTYDTQVPVLTLRGASAPVFANDMVLCGFSSGRIVALRASGGEPVWEQRVALPQGKSELDRMVDIDGEPLVENGIVYVASYQGRVKALRLQDGTPIWEREMSTHTGLANGLDQIYVVGKDDELLALDENSSTPVWQTSMFKRRSLSAPVVVDNYVVVGDAEGYLHVLTQSDGRLVAREHIGGDGLRTEMRVVDNVVYGQTVDGTLFAFKIERST